jgi:hypothetical protein
MHPAVARERAAAQQRYRERRRVREAAQLWRESDGAHHAHRVNTIEDAPLSAE